jgi:hypothetical protein
MIYCIAMLAAVAAAILCATAQVTPVKAVRSGELVIDPPTLINLGFALEYGKPAPHYGPRT